MPSLTIRHVTTYRYRQPVAFGEHRMMLRPRDSYDQRVIEASLEISPEPKSLRFVQDVFGNHVGIARFSGRSKELSFESIVCLEHSPADPAGLDLEDTQGPFRSTITPTRCRTSPTISNAINPIRTTRSAAGLANSCPRAGRSARSSFSPGFRRASIAASATGAGKRKGIQRAGGDASARPWQLPRLRHADDRGGALARSRRAVRVGYLALPLDDPEEPVSGLGARVDPCLGANLSAGRRLDRFRSDQRQRRQDRPCHRRGGARSAPRDPAPRHLHRVPSDHLGMEVQVIVRKRSATAQHSERARFGQPA